MAYVIDLDEDLTKQSSMHGQWNPKVGDRGFHFPFISKSFNRGSPSVHITNFERAVPEAFQVKMIISRMFYHE